MLGEYIFETFSLIRVLSMISSPPGVQCNRKVSALFHEAPKGFPQRAVR